MEAPAVATVTGYKCQWEMRYIRGFIHLRIYDKANWAVCKHDATDCGEIMSTNHTTFKEQGNML